MICKFKKDPRKKQTHEEKTYMYNSKMYIVHTKLFSILLHFYFVEKHVLYLKCCHISITRILHTFCVIITSFWITLQFSVILCHYVLDICRYYICAYINCKTCNCQRYDMKIWHFNGIYIEIEKSSKLTIPTAICLAKDTRSVGLRNSTPLLT